MAEPREIAGELTSGGQSRRFLLRLPPDPGLDIPLVIVLHGNHGRPGGGEMMRAVTTFDAHAAEHGFAVVYPDGATGNWADGRGVTTADEAGVDDLAFLRALIAWCADGHGTVSDRVVVAGLSNGGFMAHRMGVEAGDQVAVIAAVAGTLPEALSGQAPDHAVSALLIHGDADTTALIGGGYSRHRGPNGELRGRVVSLEESAAFWRGADRCPDGPGQVRQTGGSTRVTWTDGIGGTQVSAWTVHGMGHMWPGFQPPPEYDVPTSLEFDGAAEIWRFASGHLIPAADREIG